MIAVENHLTIPLSGEGGLKTLRKYRITIIRHKGYGSVQDERRAQA